jgi:gentisate 1,2-dioxygenase
LDAKPGVYTLLGTELSADGTIMNPTLVDWEKGAASVTPPGHWHEQVNESGLDTFVIPIQDAGLHTYLRAHSIFSFYREVWS